MQIVAKVTWQ